MKKILSLVLAAMMIFSVLPAAFAAETAVAAEVSEAQAEAIALLKELGIYKGLENGDLAADDLVQRYQMSIFATRFASGRTDDKVWVTTENDSGFTDVVDFDGARDDVLGMISYAAQAGIVNGTGNNKFEPNLNVKYKEAITMVVRALGQNYTAASYPWAYIQFANDNGLLEGIDTSIAPDEYVTRGVIAQLLYNALFAELKDEDGKAIPTVAEKNFGVGKSRVMITASNDIVYEPDASKVLKDGYVRFAVVNKQGEPIGADYHAAATAFGLADAKAENRAVGTLYDVYYKNNYADLLSVESLAVVYENRGHDNMQVKASSANNGIYEYDALTYYGDKDQYVTIDGTKYQVVTSYDELYKNQGANSNKAGTPEMKVFTEYGAGDKAVLMPGLVLSNDGKTIYKMGTSYEGFFEPYATYSDAMGVWYGKVTDATGAKVWKIFTTAELYATVDNDLSDGFGQKTNASLANAYADITVSANERMTIRQYQFGYITFTTNTRVDQYGTSASHVKTGVKTFTLQTRTASTTGALSNDNTTYRLYDSQISVLKNENGDVIDWGLRPVNDAMTQGTVLADGTIVKGTEYYADEYTWTGIPHAELKNGYIIYYINHETREICVIDTITDAADGDDSYIIKNTYIRGFDLATDSITVGADYTTYKYDYNNITGTSLKGKANNSNNTSNNYAYLKDLYNIPVNLVIVDGKVVHIEKAASNEFVIIDNFVSFEEDGIVANAWSTVDNGYTQIKIASYNGWTVGGIDYWYYFFGAYTGTPSALTIPFNVRTLYKVVGIEDGKYDLTDMFTTIDGSDDREFSVNVIKEGYVENVDKANNKLVAGKFTATADTDYWMILDLSNDNVQAPNPKNREVYSLNGKVNPVQFLAGADFYKANGDYVIVVGAGEMEGAGLFAGDVAFYKYNSKVNLYDNENYLVSNSFNTYNYSLYMVNVLTGKTELVQLANDTVLGVGNSGYNAYAMYEDIRLNHEGDIFMVEDGILKDTSDANVWTEDMVAAYYYGAEADYQIKSFAGVDGTALAKGSTAIDVLDIVNAAMVEEFLTGATSSIGYFDGNITVFFRKNTKAATTYSSFNGAQAGRRITNGSYAYNSNVTALNDMLANEPVYYVYFVVNKATQTATAWVVASTESFAKAPSAATTTTWLGNGVNGSTASDSNLDTTVMNTTYSFSLNEATDVLTVTVAYNNATLVSDTTVYTASYTPNGASYILPKSIEKTVGADGKLTKLVLVFEGVAEYAAGDALVVQIDRSADSYSNIRQKTVIG